MRSLVFFCFFSFCIFEEKHRRLTIFVYLFVHGALANLCHINLVEKVKAYTHALIHKTILHIEYVTTNRQNSTRISINGLI